MVFQQETSEQLRRRILESCQDQIREPIDALKEICLLIAAYQKGDENEVFHHHHTITEMEEKADAKKRAIMTEIASAEAVMLSREDFIRLTSDISTISDYCSGVSYRIAELAKRRWKVNEEVMRDLGVLAEAVLDSVIRLREAILALVYGGPNVIETTLKVESAEKNVDNIYRKTDFSILASSMKISLVLLVREVAEFLEEIADAAENTADTVRILSLTT